MKMRWKLYIGVGVIHAPIVFSCSAVRNAVCGICVILPGAFGLVGARYWQLVHCRAKRAPSGFSDVRKLLLRSAPAMTRRHKGYSVQRGKD